MAKRIENNSNHIVCERIVKKVGISKVDLVTIVNAYFEEMSIMLSEGESINIRNFGTFLTRKRKEMKSHNIHKMKMTISPSHYFVKFSPAPKLKERVRKELKVIE